MLAKRLFILASTAFLGASCSGSSAKPRTDGGRGGAGGDTSLIVPEGLTVSLEEGGAGVLKLYALTLRDGPDGVELYAALTNDGDVPACDAAFKVTLFDKAGQPLGNYINGLYTSQFYLYVVSDASTTIAACVSPGNVTMTRIATMASNFAVADVGSVVYYYSYFALDAVPIDGLSVGPLTTAATDGGVAYAGTVTNRLDMAVTGPSVAVFSLNAVGRPLAITTASDNGQVPPGGSWNFQTAAIDTPGVGNAAFPSASF